MQVKWKSAVFISSVTLCVGGFSVGAVAQRNQKDESAGASKSAPEVRELLKARLILAKKGYDASAKSFGEVRRLALNFNFLVTKPEEVHTWSARWLQAERELSTKPADDISAMQAHLARMEALHAKVKSLVPELLPEVESQNAEWYCLEAKLWLAKAKTK